MKYRLNILGWYSFEMLVKTLLKTVIGSGVTSFGGTKDGGRDAAFIGKAPYPSNETNWDRKWIFQVKYSDSESKDLGDKRIKARQQRNDSLYSWATALKLVQSYGRSVRSENDRATTYILDSDFGYFLQRAKQSELLNHDFLDALRRV